MAGNVIVVPVPPWVGCWLAQEPFRGATGRGGDRRCAGAFRVAPDQVDYVIMGHVLQAGGGQITARQAAVEAGIPMSVPAVTVNKVCLSGIDAIALADHHRGWRVRDRGCRRHGVDDQRPAPARRLPRGRQGDGDWKAIDPMAFDGLTCAFDQCAMGSRPAGTTPLRLRPRRAGRLRRRSPEGCGGSEVGCAGRGDRRRRDSAAARGADRGRGR